MRFQREKKLLKKLHSNKRNLNYISFNLKINVNDKADRNKMFAKEYKIVFISIKSVQCVREITENE